MAAISFLPSGSAATEIKIDQMPKKCPSFFLSFFLTAAPSSSVEELPSRLRPDELTGPDLARVGLGGVQVEALGHVAGGRAADVLRVTSN